jgi:hypothetical protein
MSTSGIALLKMDSSNVLPVLPQELNHQPAVAVFGRRFAAKQYGAAIEEFRRELLLHLALARLYRQNRSLARYRGIPEVLIDAVLAAEDARFFEHPGYDLKAIARAALANLREGEVVQGGSTITQQYVKNVYFRDPPKTLRRKARELRIAIEIEKLYSKKEILERYLNTVYFGDGAYGVVAASETFFDRRLKSLNLSQNALLAAIIKSPSFYNPRSHPRHARVRRNYILDRMVELGRISPRRGMRARRAPLGVISKPPRITTSEPYFVEAVKREVLEQRPHEQLGRECIAARVAERVEHLDGRAVAARRIDRTPHGLGRAEHDGLDQAFALERHHGLDDAWVRAFGDRDPMTQVRCALPYVLEEGAHPTPVVRPRNPVSPATTAGPAATFRPASREPRRARSDRSHRRTPRSPARATRRGTSSGRPAPGTASPAAARGAGS